MKTTLEISKYHVRSAAKDDEPFLFEMLFQSLFIEEGQEPYSREVLSKPNIARYVKDWGRTGDLGFIAEMTDSDEKLGATWCRLAHGEDRGFAYLDDKTPELGIAILPEYRGKGIGTKLLENLLTAAEEKYPAICLSVSPNNPAIRLYEKFGFETVDLRNQYPVMRLIFD